MKDLIFITAHCPSEEQERALERCIDSVSKSGYHIALLSHTHIPFHIQKKCNFYFYDYLNDTSEDVDLLPPGFLFSFGDKIIKSIFFVKNFYGFAIYRMFSMASQIAINFGYKNIHHIEYDGEVLDLEILKQHNELLENYDSILYTTTGDSDGFMFGSLKSARVDKLPRLFTDYNRDEIEKRIRDFGQNVHLEYITKTEFNNHTNVLFRKESELNGFFKKGEHFYERNLHYTLFYDKKDNKIKLFYNSQKNEEETVIVIINNSEVHTLNVKPNHWYIETLYTMDEVKTIRIDNSEKIIYEKHFDDTFKEIFKLKSHVIYEENN